MYNAHPYFSLKNLGKKVHIIHDKIRYSISINSGVLKRGSLGVTKNTITEKTPKVLETFKTFIGVALVNKMM